MKINFYRISLLFIFWLGIQTNSFSQSNHLEYLAGLSTHFSSQETLPFWMTSNKYGSIPNSNNLILETGIFKNFKEDSYYNHGVSYGIQTTASLADKNNLIINQLFLSFKWKNLALDLGAKHRDVLFEGLSSSNGEITYSNNARSMPGINIKLTEFIELPFAKSWLKFKGNYSEYLMNDKRVVDNAQLHHKSLHFQFKLNSKLNLISGVDHYVQWGGTSPEFGKQPSGIKNYLKIITGNSGGANAAPGDQQNALGNHLGAYLLQLNKIGEKTDWSFYISHPFEDASGRELSNYPDNLFGLFIDFKKPTNFITHVLAEFSYTKDHGGKASANNFKDNYFNNKIYKSGWTYFGRTIGSPFFLTNPVGQDGITRGIVLGYNRFTSINIGVKGVINSKIKYKTNFSYTKYAGWFNSPIQNDKLYSTQFELNYHSEKFPLDFSLGTSTDFGDLLPNNFGGYLKIIKKGKF